MFVQTTQLSRKKKGQRQLGLRRGSAKPYGGGNGTIERKDQVTRDASKLERQVGIQFWKIARENQILGYV